MNARFADIAVNAPVGTRRLFSYEVPEGMAVQQGQAVRVPFGPRVVQGIVFELVDVPAVPEVRPIEAAIGAEPLLAPHHLRLARWMADRYLASYFDAAALWAHPGFRQRVRMARKVRGIIAAYFDLKPKCSYSVFGNLSAKSTPRTRAWPSRPSAVQATQA